jgi:hypothetical protein
LEIPDRVVLLSCVVVVKDPLLFPPRQLRAQLSDLEFELGPLV